MKRVLLILLCILIGTVFAACANSSRDQAESPEQTAAESSPEVSAEDSAASDVEGSSEPSAQPSESDASADSQITASTADENDAQESTSAEDAQTSPVLVAYFSATGTTKGVAEKIAAAESADLYEITPTMPYTDDDLNYNSDSSRTTEEQNDDTSRPAISGEVPDWDNYSIVYLGYPIWWGEAPRIMDTFVESYNFDSKTVIPFCTSGGSGIGSSAKNLETLSDGGTWLDGTRFNGSVSEAEIADWVEETVPLN